MNEAFHISQVTLRRRRWTLSAVPLVPLAIVAFQFHSSAEDPLNFAIGAAALVTITIFVARSRYKRFVVLASHHSVELKEDALLLKFGDVETRIPYQSIAQVVVIGSLTTPRLVHLKLADCSKETLYGYADIHRLLEGLLERTPTAAVRVNRWINV